MTCFDTHIRGAVNQSLPTEEKMTFDFLVSKCSENSAASNAIVYRVKFLTNYSPEGAMSVNPTDHRRFVRRIVNSW